MTKRIIKKESLITFGKIISSVSIILGMPPSTGHIDMMQYQATTMKRTFTLKF